MQHVFTLFFALFPAINAFAAIESSSSLPFAEREKSVSASAEMKLESSNRMGASFTTSAQATSKSRYSLSAGATNLSFKAPAQGELPASSFWESQVGTSFNRTLSARSSYNLSLGVSSSSDRRIAPTRDLGYNMSWAYTHGAAEGLSRWTYGLSFAYVPSGASSFPFPFASYYYHHSELWQFNIGLPLSATFAPTSKLSFEASYVPAAAVTAKSNYKFTKANKLYLGYSLSNMKTFRLANREKQKEAIYFDESRYFAGWQTESLKPATLGVEVAYAYNRDFWKGEKPGSVNGKVGLPNQWSALTTATFPIL